MARISPKTEALAYRIWGVARQHEWNCTLIEIADALGESVHRVSTTAMLKGWLGRFRAGSRPTAADAWLNGRREIDGVVLIGMDGLETLGAHHG